MATGTLPPVAAVATLPAEGRAAVLDLLFEPCPQLHALTAELLRSQPFSSYGDLVAAVGRQLADLAASAAPADARSLEAILAAHPRLGEARPLSAQSRAEQAQLNAGDDGEAGRLTALNSAYEKAFPGLRYV
jgi:2-oxo-4-hydroxy-4-carboxy--5-ureidoimidazoline (OHCU) decarboxylase